MSRLLIVLVSMLLVACSTFSEPTPTAIPTPVEPPTPTPEPSPTPAFVFGGDPFSQGMLARRNGDYARAIAAFQAVLASRPSPELAQEAQYRLGEAYWLYHDDPGALNALNAYLQAYATGTHAPEVHYFLADSHRTQKNYANALAHLRAYRAVTPSLAGDTDAGIADLMILAGDSDGALEQYDRALQDTILAPAARVSILVRAGDVHTGRGQPALAAARYDAAQAAATDARTRADMDLRAGEAYATAGQAEQAVARWTDAVNKYPEQPSAHKALVNLVNRNIAVDSFQRGLVDYYAGSFDAALTALQSALKSNSARAGDARYYRGLSYAKKGNYAQAIAEYDVIIKTLTKDKRVADAYLGKASAYASLGKTDDAVAVYKKFAAAFPNDAQADDALWRAALLLEKADRYTAAAALFEDLQAKYPTRERASEALFWAGLDHYRVKDYKTASTRWQTLAKEYAKSSFSPRALFWLGKAAFIRGQTDSAKTYWTQAAATGNNYYAWRARDLLKPPSVSISYEPVRYAMDNPADRAELDQWLLGWTKTTGVPGNLDAATQADVRFRRGAELLRLDRTVEARREFAAFISAKQEDARALYALAFYLRDNNQFSLSMDSAERIAKLAASAGAPDAPRLLWMLRYPTYYADLVLAETQTNQIDPLLYWALIRQESSFNTWSTSSADARGLGQIIPSTGKEIAQRLGAKSYALDQLYLPFINLHFGVWYFAQGLKTFSEPIYALAAYNGGAGRTKRWQQSDLDLAVEEIDASETGLYVRIVYSNWRQYQTTYAR